jgi:hypothetical protein
MNEIARIKEMSPQDLMALGLEQVAYVKPIVVDGAAAVAVHAADGTQMAVLASRDLAFAAIRQNNLEPASVH